MSARPFFTFYSEGKGLGLQRLFGRRKAAGSGPGIKIRFELNGGCMSMRKFKKTKKPNMDAIHLLVSILVCYPEIATVSFEPAEDAMHMSFALREVPSEASFAAAGQFLRDSILTYHQLEGFSNAHISISLEAQGHTAFLHIVRDVSTLSRGEIRLLAALMKERFASMLLLDQERDITDLEAEEAQEETIDHMLGNVKINRITDRMIGIREEGRVMVFNK